MRARSKSVSFAADSLKYSDEESKDDDSDAEFEESKLELAQSSTSPQTKKGENDPWTAEEQLTMLCNVQKLVPKEDDIPYDRRMKTIDWQNVRVAGRSAKAVKSEFRCLIQSARTFRVLSEIIEEMHADTLPKLGLERPTAAFALFIRENRDKIEKYAASAQSPKKSSFTHFGAQVFNECSEEERNKYKKRAQKMREKYEEAIKRFELPKWKKENMKREKKSRANGGQRKEVRITPCLLYVQLKAMEDPDHPKAYYRAKYAALPKEEKIEWILRWLGLRKGQKANLEQYLKCKMNLVKPEMDIFDEYEGRPRRLSAYNLFMRAKLNTNKSLANSHKDNFKSCVDEWKNLPDHEKAEYMAAAKKLKSNFTANFSRFVTSLPTDRLDYEISSLNEKEEKQNDSTSVHTPLAKKPTEGRVPPAEGSDDDDDDETAHPDGSVVPPDRNDDEDNSSYNYIDDDHDEMVYQCDTGSMLNRKTNPPDGVNESSDEDDEELTLPSETPGRNSKQIIHSTPYTVVHTTLGSSQAATNPDTPTVTSKSSLSLRKAANKTPSSPVQKTSAKEAGDKTKGSKGNSKVADQRLPPPSRKTTASDSEHTPSKIKTEQLSDSAEESLTSKMQKRKPEQVAPSSAFKKFKDNSSEQSVNLTPTKSDSSMEALKKKFLKLLSNKPPETLLEYYADMSFNGIQKKAKKALKMLSKKDKEELSSTYERAKEKYSKRFNAFSQILSPIELSLMSAEFTNPSRLKS